MATYLEKMKQNQQQQTPQQGLRGVSQQTQAQLQNYQQPYQQTQQAQAAKQNLQNVQQQQKPQSYSSKWSGALDNILQQIQNPGEFKYSLDGDGLFQSYKDMYTQKAKQGARHLSSLGLSRRVMRDCGSHSPQKVSSSCCTCSP